MTGHSTIDASTGRRWPVKGWQLVSVPPDSLDSPDAVSRASLSWVDVEEAGTAAASLRAAKRWTLDDPARRFDAEDWWFRARFPRPALRADAPVSLGFDGLATLAEVWLNGEKLLDSDNMFVAHSSRVDSKLRDDNEIVIRCRALDAALKARRPRPRWRVPMLENQQLRWFRTTLLGRTPGWSPPAAPVGPWRPVWIEAGATVSICEAVLSTSVVNGSGRVQFSGRLETCGANRIESATLLFERGGRRFAKKLAMTANAGRYAVDLDIPDVERWYPHTHGEPALYEARIDVRFAGSDEAHTIPLRRVGFREVSLSKENGDFSLSINGTAVFCRGACWTPLDPVSLRADRAMLAAALTQVKTAGMNMLRLSGTMVYESDEFLDLCDELGILLWQDFMFASMDYPDGDSTFDASVTDEARQQLARLAGRPSVAVLCGNSEVEQQAAMWGAERALWSPALFHRKLAELANEVCPDVPYWPSSAHGGSFPHLATSGTTSYYGVGAYLRPLEDARRAELRFATECLAFANVPSDRTLGAVPGVGALRSHHAAWKARSPRDLGVGWDFDDVRDHYLAKLFGVSALELRYSDHSRYLELSRVAIGEVMSATFGEWRRARSTCRGALIWFLRDLWPGAGWGVVDSTGAAKAPWHYLRRALQPVSVSLSDEGGNGLFVHVVNETASAIEATLELTLYRDQTVVNRDARALALPARGSLEIPAGEFFAGFVDTAYAYRFGPPPHDLAVASLRYSSGGLLAEAFQLVGGFARTREADLGLSAQAARRGDGSFELVVETRRFAQSVHVDVEGFMADDDFFHVAPGTRRSVVLRRIDGAAVEIPRGIVQALNGLAPARVSVAP